MKVLVTGGRDFNDTAKLYRNLDNLHESSNITHIIHGAADGADALAGRWARARGIQEIRCPANWAFHGNSAGHVRNRAMLALKPDMVMAFPGGRGTADMKDAASKAKIKIIYVL